MVATRQCLNCNHKNSVDDIYCRNCGQKTSDPKLSFGAIVANFFVNVFNLDSKFLSSLRSLFIPGKFTVDFVAGKRVKYYSPGRILFVSMVIFFFLLAMTISKLSDTDKWSNINEQAWKSSLTIKFDSLSTMYREEMQDSLVYLDSLSKQLFESDDTTDFIQFNPSLSDTSTNHEIFKLMNWSEEDYFKEKNITNPTQQFLYRQLKKSVKDVKGTVNFMIGNLTWMFILIAITIAGLMKLLYIRRGYYFAEHVIFQMHFLSFGIVSGSIFLIVTMFREEFDPIIFGSFSLLSGIYLLIALQRYYKQHFIKTFIKFTILLFGYLFCFISFVFLIALASFVLL